MVLLRREVKEGSVKDQSAIKASSFRSAGNAGGTCAP
jgi:hypothetical protein